MNPQEKGLKELESRLRADNPVKVIETIKLLRNEEPFHGVIRLLAELYNATSNMQVKSQVAEFMNDMKEKTLAVEVVTEIKKKYKNDTTKMLASSCWQSGIDYAPYASEFAQVFVSGDFETAIECFTVIESNIHGIARKTKDHMIILLRESDNLKNSQKSALMQELLVLLAERE